MALFEITDDGLVKQDVASFSGLGLKEREDLQRVLRDQIDALGEDLLVIAEEFGNWQDAKRRIDLLALDRSGRLVVIELKRTDDGGHMELQAIRYAAMVSSMGLEEVIEAYEKHCTAHRPDESVDAAAEVREFLQRDGDEPPTISNDVRIILVSADFGKEITTTVLWLNRLDGMDIRCVRLVAYKIDERVLIDVQQVIPLAEAADYQVRLRRKEAARERSLVSSTKDYTRYHVVVDGKELPKEAKRHAVRVMVSSLVAKGIAPSTVRAALPRPAKMREVPGAYSDQEAVEGALLAAQPDLDLRRWFTTSPFVDTETSVTYVLSSQWGTITEETLQALVASFPDAGVTFRAATEV